MKRVPGHFEFLFTTDCRYSRPKITGDVLRICVKELGLMKGHPARAAVGENLVYVPRCHFIFEQVALSSRRLTPYVGNPRLGKFGLPYEEHDGPFIQKPDARQYAFEGRLEDPLAWVDWVVRARSFSLEISDPI